MVDVQDGVSSEAVKTGLVPETCRRSAPANIFASIFRTRRITTWPKSDRLLGLGQAIRCQHKGIPIGPGASGKAQQPAITDKVVTTRIIATSLCIFW